MLTAVSASIGTAGVPGVGTIMLAMVFESVGLPAEGVAMIMGIDRLLDMGRTAINVTGDAVVTTCMAKLSGMLDKDVFDNLDYAAISVDDLIDTPASATNAARDADGPSAAGGRR